MDEAVMGLSVHTDEDGGGDNPLLWVCAASLQRNRKPTLIPVTYRSLRVWLWVWRQLLRCCMRLCASVVT